ncbi:MAG: hypothetical protein JNL40_15755 [Cyclobacteriaceae bacterium]|nr:hypothetical protein [Cyclobacteriaceae bacterium]
MNLLFILLLLLTPQETPQPPLKAAEEFKLELQYEFKARPDTENAFIDLTETEREKEKRISGSSPLPYLVIHMSFLKLSDQEVRVRCVDNNRKNRFSKKVELGKVYSLDLGFTEDMKDRVTAYQYIFYLMSADKKDVSQVNLIVEQDGTFLVNGVRRGKF